MNRHFILQAIDEKGKSVFIDDVPNGKNCGCYCKECGGALIARQGNIKVLERKKRVLFIDNLTAFLENPRETTDKLGLLLNARRRPKYKNPIAANI
jgi:hypothetical protein